MSDKTSGLTLDVVEMYSHVILFICCHVVLPDRTDGIVAVREKSEARKFSSHPSLIMETSPIFQPGRVAEILTVLTQHSGFISVFSSPAKRPTY